MQTELDQEGLGSSVQILGLNAIGHDGSNALAVKDIRLPWLQDTANVKAWDSWGATWRDVVVVNGQGLESGVYNLTDHDLAVAANRDQLKTLILGAIAQ